MNIEFSNNDIAIIVAQRLATDSNFAKNVASFLAADDVFLKDDLVKEYVKQILLKKDYMTYDIKSEVRREMEKHLAKEIKTEIGRVLGSSLATAVAKVADRVSVDVLKAFNENNQN